MKTIIIDGVEYNLTPKIMFKNGTWLVENEPNNYARFIQILEVVDVQGKERYKISRDLHNDEDVVECRFIENNYHSFNIQDANNGDVLQLGEVTAIFKEFIGNNNCKCYCSVHSGEFEIPSQGGADNNYGCYNATPATKEQCDTLMKAMADAGYTFDFEKKELKKVVQKLAWSEEDERLCKCIIKDQEEALDNVRNDKYGHSEIISDLKDMYRERINWLKSLKDKVQYTQTNWNEEDEETLGWLCTFLKEYGNPFYNGNEENVIDWLKSLKERVQLQWKPNDEQLKALNTMNVTGCITEVGQGKSLVELYKQLKKLKG